MKSMRKHYENVISELRKELEQVTAERDKAISDLGSIGVGICKFCEHADGIFCNCEEQCVDKDQWKWKG